MGAMVNGSLVHNAETDSSVLSFDRDNAESGGASE